MTLFDWQKRDLKAATAAMMERYSYAADRSDRFARGSLVVPDGDLNGLPRDEPVVPVAGGSFPFAAWLPWRADTCIYDGCGAVNRRYRNTWIIRPEAALILDMIPFDRAYVFFTEDDTWGRALMFAAHWHIAKQGKYTEAVGEKDGAMNGTFNRSGIWKGTAINAGKLASEGVALSFPAPWKHSYELAPCYRKEAVS